MTLRARVHIFSELDLAQERAAAPTTMAESPLASAGAGPDELWSAHLAVFDTFADFGIPEHDSLVSRARPYIRAVT